MDELIKINYDSERPTVSGRDLHAALQITTKYADCFPECANMVFRKELTISHF